VIIARLRGGCGLAFHDPWRVSALLMPPAVPELVEVFALLVLPPLQGTAVAASCGGAEKWLGGCMTSFRPGMALRSAPKPPVAKPPAKCCCDLYGDGNGTLRPPASSRSEGSAFCGCVLCCCWFSCCCCWFCCWELAPGAGASRLDGDGSAAYGGGWLRRGGCGCCRPSIGKCEWLQLRCDRFCPRRSEHGKVVGGGLRIGRAW
jgi:hypothetical protein